jgi:hypothetical protein
VLSLLERVSRLPADPVPIQRVADLMLKFGLFQVAFDIRPMLR